VVVPHFILFFASVFCGMQRALMGEVRSGRVGGWEGAREVDRPWGRLGVKQWGLTVFVNGGVGYVYVYVCRRGSVRAGGTGVWRRYEGMAQSLHSAVGLRVITELLANLCVVM